MEKEALFSGVEHIGIKAVNMEKAIDFYQEVLGFKFLSRFKPGETELAFLELNGTVVELVEIKDGKHYEDGVINHLALRVTDILKAIEYLKAKQIELPAAEPMSIGGGRYNLFFHGPSGEKIELYQG